MSTFESTTPDLGTPSNEGVAPDTGVVAPDAGVDLPPGAAELLEPAAPEGAAPPAQEPRYLDLDEFGDHLVKIKVGGEDRELPFSEVRNGLMMQQDYTHKTQELAEARRRLYQAEALVAAIEQNPAEVIAQLAEANDLDIHGGLAPVQRTPEEQQLRAMQQQTQQLRAQAAKAQLDAEIAQIQTIDPDFDVVATAQYAHDNGIPLPMAHRLMRAEAQERAATQAAETERRRQAAAAAQIAHQGGSAQAGSVVTPEKPATSVRDAYLAAVAAHRN